MLTGDPVRLAAQNHFCLLSCLHVRLNEENRKQLGCLCDNMILLGEVQKKMTNLSRSCWMYKQAAVIAGLRNIFKENPYIITLLSGPTVYYLPKLICKKIYKEKNV